MAESSHADFDRTCEAASAAIVRALDARWRPPRDPEVRANLARLDTEIRECRRIASDGLRDLAVEAIRTGLVEPDGRLRRLRVDGVRQLVRRFDDLLIEFGDDAFLFALAEEEYVRSDPAIAPSVSWARLFGDRRLGGSAAFAAGLEVSFEQRLAARRSLLALHRAQWDLYNLGRGRAEAKAHFLARLNAVMLAALAAFGGAIGVAGPAGIWSKVFLTAAAGAIGGSVSAAFKVRDSVTKTSELRTFAPAVAIQPVVGAIAGLFVLLVLESGFVKVNPGGGEWATWGAVAFVVGFSEPFFLNVVGRVSAVAEGKKDGG